MREIRSSGSVRGGDGNVPTYSANDAVRVAEEVADKLCGVVCEDRMVGFNELEAILCVEYGIGRHWMQRLR